MYNLVYGQSVQGNQGYAQAASPEAYHTANYRGNQIGHDAYLRSDSQTPSSFQAGVSSYGMNAQAQNQFGMNQFTQQYGMQPNSQHHLTAMLFKLTNPMVKLLTQMPITQRTTVGIN
ncbi:hypothetical protein [Paenibacillus hexagrammi]|uniref:Uncharacterized protein n=1 Tax=Paenibacillus hexagrammi TaxID=2908839 RepID=A0ABY3SNE3_9BACL|nr:hypothetical protein [Paenibacillus sp. YPD9-1]UJF35239.1 hypothetical protein L0M14_09010 [Paenibacillus sp. YPD9-1]